MSDNKLTRVDNEDKKKAGLTTRLVSGIVGAILFFVVLIFNKSFPIVINICVSIVCMLAINEVFNLIGIKKKYLVTIPSLIFVAVFPIFGFSVLWQTCWYLYTLLIFIAFMRFDENFTLKEALAIYAMSLLITLALGKIVEIRNFNSAFGSMYVCFALSVAWLTDTGAYFFGSYLGKNKLCPDISPKKTIEGVIGGIVSCVVGSLLILVLFKHFIFTCKFDINYFIVLVVSLVGSIISVFGDLCFSAIKRGYKVKDFGNIMPGHGGILDRFDSVIFVVPYIYVCMNLLPLIKFN